MLIPRLVGYIVINHGGKNAAGLLSHGMLQVYPDKGVDGDAIDLVVELVRCFGIMMYEPEKAALQRSMLEIFDNERVNSVTKKKAIVAISLLAVYFSEQSLSSFVLGVIDSLRSAHLTLPKRRQLLALIGSLARSIPQRLGPHIKALVPYVLSPLSKQDYDESFQEFTDEGALNPLVEDVKEAALVALEVCLSSCINDMRPFTEESINVGVRYVNYDPNIANDGSDEDMNDNNDTAENEEDLQDVDNEDEDFEEEGGMSDDDDTSWKVRRCATKVLYALIATRGIGDLLDDGTLYDRVAPALIACFKEREENVRLEVLATLAALIKQTGEGVTIRTTTNDDESYISAAIATNSRKRRRGGSDSSMFDANGTNSSKDLASPVTSPFPISGPKADLHRLSSLMIPGVAKILKQTPVPTKQAAVTLLKNFVLVQNGGLSEHLGRIADPIFDAISISSNLVGGSTSSAAGGAASATGSSLRIEALHLLGAICDTHSSTVIAPYIDKIIPLVVTAVKDTYFKVSSEALRVVESVVKVLTPPRSSDTGVTQQKTITALFDVILNRIQATDADVEVRQRSIHALGVLLSRTSATKLLPWKMREPAMNTLLERLRNETTRLASINAINLVALSSSSKGELEPVWVRKVALDLGAQLRKSDRILRGASLGALKSVAVNARYIAALDDETVNHLVAMLLPLMDPNDLSLLALALNVITELIKRNPRNVVNNDLNRALCNIVLVPISGQVLDAYLRVVETIGSEGSGLPLMQALLRDIGVTGDPTIVGTAIGTLLVSGSLTVGVQIDDFIKELRDAQDDLRKCLALSILGEAGLRLGASSPLKPDTFTPHFKSKSDRVPRAAAIALGRAGAGNPSAYLPVILKSMNAEGAAQYLLLHSLREILQYTGKARIDISDYTEEIWTKSLASSRIEDNKAIGAECIGKLVIIAPKTYLPLLQVSLIEVLTGKIHLTLAQDHLQDTSPTIRGMAIQAVRFTFPDTDETLDEALKPVLVNMLMTMLGDSALDNRKLALTCLNSATHNKPRIVLPYLAQLMPLVLQDSKVNPELVREVKMGPFTHKVDDGLEVRKVSLANTSSSRYILTMA